MEIVSADRSNNGLIIAFEDDKTAIFPAELLYAALTEFLVHRDRAVRFFVLNLFQKGSVALHLPKGGRQIADDLVVPLYVGVAGFRHGFIGEMLFRRALRWQTIFR